MKTKTFTFVPDGHYAYPEVIHDSFHINTMDELLKYYEDAAHTALTMGDWEDGPYEAFIQFGYNSYYENLYIIAYEENIGDEEIINHIENVHQNNMDDIMYEYDDLPAAGWSYEPGDNPWTNGKISNDFLKKLVERDDIIAAISVGKINEFTLNKRHPKMDMDEILSIVLDNLIAKEIRKGNKSKAGEIYLNIANSIEGIDTLLSSILSPEEMKNLKIISKGHSILGRFKFK